MISLIIRIIKLEIKLNFTTRRHWTIRIIIRSIIHRKYSIINIIKRGLHLQIIRIIYIIVFYESINIIIISPIILIRTIRHIIHNSNIT